MLGPLSSLVVSASEWRSPERWWEARPSCSPTSPTGNLDQATGQAILGLFQELHKLGVTIAVITHDRNIASRMERRIEMLDGRIRVRQYGEVLNAADARSW